MLKQNIPDRPYVLCQREFISIIGVNKNPMVHLTMLK